MGVKNLTGAPWHPEKDHRAEDDDRRYKGRCVFYSYDKDTCKKYCGRCRGSAHCTHYKAISEEEFKLRKKESRKSNRQSSKEDDYYWL